jgi:hypothetical protein
MTIFATPVRCPSCRAEALQPVFDGEDVNFFCRSCQRCWHQALNAIHRVPPPTCPGCRHHDDCHAAWARDHGPDRD